MPYAGSKAAAGQGTQLQYGGPFPGTPSYVTLAEVIKIQRSGSKMDIVDVTNMDSAGAYREKLATLLDGGEISFEANYIPTDPTQVGMQGLFDNRTLGQWAIVLPNTLGTWTFNAYSISDDFDIPVDKQMTFTGKLAITGKPVFTAG
jgi:predicted secreted protein